MRRNAGLTREGSVLKYGTEYIKCAYNSVTCASKKWGRMERLKYKDDSDLSVTIYPDQTVFTNFHAISIENY